MDFKDRLTNCNNNNNTMGSSIPAASSPPTKRQRCEAAFPNATTWTNPPKEDSGTTVQPFAPSDAFSSQSSYVQITSRTRQPHVNTTLRNNRAASTMTPKHIHVHRRTQILKRLPLATTTETIIRDITKQFNFDKDPRKLIEIVIRDREDPRRYYITYTTLELKRHVTRKGFKIGNTAIPGEPGDVTAFIPYLPYYATEDDIRDLLKPYGQILTGEFRQDKYGIRTGGYSFTMDLNEGQLLPEQLSMYDETFSVINRDDKRHCT